jgi:hypothetical protein
MSIIAKSATFNGPLADIFGRGKDLNHAPLIEAEPFYTELRIKQILAGSRTWTDDIGQVTEEVFSGFVEDTLTRAPIPLADFIQLRQWAEVDDTAGTYEMIWQPDGSRMIAVPPFPPEGTFYMAIERAGQIQTDSGAKGLPPDPKKPRHIFALTYPDNETIVGTRTITPPDDDPVSEDIYWVGGPILNHLYSAGAGEDWITNRVPFDILSAFFGGGVAIDIPTTGWSAARWRDQRVMATGTWNDDEEPWDSSTFTISVEVELG